MCSSPNPANAPARQLGRIFAPRPARSQGGETDEQGASSSRNEEGRVHSDIGWKAQAVGRQRPPLWRLGNVSPQGIARRSESAIRVADQRLVRAGDTTLR